MEKKQKKMTREIRKTYRDQPLKTILNKSTQCLIFYLVNMKTTRLKQASTLQKKRNAARYKISTTNRDGDQGISKLKSQNLT